MHMFDRVIILHSNLEIPAPLNYIQRLHKTESRSVRLLNNKRYIIYVFIFYISRTPITSSTLPLIFNFTRDFKLMQCLIRLQIENGNIQQERRGVVVEKGIRASNAMWCKTIFRIHKLQIFMSKLFSEYIE